MSKDDSQSWIVFQSYHSLCMWRHCPKCINKHWSVVEVPRIRIERFPIESCLYREEVQKRSFPRKGNQAQTATPSNTRFLQRLMVYFRQPQSQAESEAGMIDSKERYVRTLAAGRSVVLPTYKWICWQRKGRNAFTPRSPPGKVRWNLTRLHNVFTKRIK